MSQSAENGLPVIGPRDPSREGETSADRLMRSLDYRLSPPGTPRLTRAQVAVVMHALADHTAIMQALGYARGGPDEPWPDALSMGRWFHAVGDQLDRDDRPIPPGSGGSA